MCWDVYATKFLTNETFYSLFKLKIPTSFDFIVFHVTLTSFFKKIDSQSVNSHSFDLIMNAPKVIEIIREAF